MQWIMCEGKNVDCFTSLFCSLKPCGLLSFGGRISISNELLSDINQLNFPRSLIAKIERVRNVFHSVSCELFIVRWKANEIGCNRPTLNRMNWRRLQLIVEWRKEEFWEGTKSIPINDFTRSSFIRLWLGFDLGRKGVWWWMVDFDR